MSRPMRVLSSSSINIFTILALVFFSVDGFPLVFPTTYRPLSILFIIPVFMLIVLNSIYKRKLDASVLAGLLALVGLSLVSLLVTRQAGLDLGGFIDFFITFAIGISTFAVFRYTFVKVRNNTASNDEYTKVIFKYLAVGCILMILVGVIELLAIYTPILPAEIKTTVNTIFSGKSAGRLQLTAGEPSWAARQALFGLPVLLIVKGKNSAWTIMLFLLAILTFSLEGLVILFISFLVYLVYRNWDRKFVLVFNLMKIIAGIVVVVAVVYVIGKGLFEERNRYFYSRIKQFSELKIENLSFSDLMYVDESVFIRVASPMIGLYMFLDHPIFGAGGGSFRYYYGKYVQEKFPRALHQENYSFLKQQIRKKRDQGKNFYTRVLGEFGLVGVAIFIFFLKNIISRLRAASFTDGAVKRYLYLWLFITLATLLQFDSFAYINFWLMAAFILSLAVPIPRVAGEAFS